MTRSKGRTEHQRAFDFVETLRLDIFGLSTEEWTAILLSLRISVVATLASLPLGILVALLLARGRFWGKSVLNGIVHLPLILPPVVTGFLLLILFGRRGPIGSLLDQYLGIVFSFRWPVRHSPAPSWPFR